MSSTSDCTAKTVEDSSVFNILFSRSSWPFLLLIATLSLILFKRASASASRAPLAASSRKVNHALKLLSNLENMKKRNIVCDFEITVSDVSFPVHRAVLIATSEYFERLFSSDIKEVREGCIVMRGITPKGTECCVEFMYTGDVHVTSSNVQSILEASHFMQLDEVIKICLQYLRENLSIKTSLLAVKLFQIYGTNDDQNSANQYVISHFKDVVQTEMFNLIDKEDLVRYLEVSKLRTGVRLQALVTWMEHNKISLTFLIGILWKHPFVQNNDRAKALVLKTLSEKEDNMESEMSLEIGFILKEIARNHFTANSDRFNKVLDKYLARNFEKVIERDEFCDISLKDLTSILQSEDLYCPEESVKWEALIKWAKHDKLREKDLVVLMTFLNLEKILVEYIQQNIRTEPMVMKSDKCKDILLDALYAHASPTSPQPNQRATATPISTFVMLDERSGILTGLDVENGHHAEITRIEKKSFLRIISIEEELYLFQNEQLYNYSNSGNWEKREALQKCPNPWYTQAVVFHNKIYVIDRISTFCYNPPLNIWTDSLPGCELGGGFCVAASPRSIYALGGAMTGRQAERFIPGTKRWSTIAPMRDARWDAAAVVHHENLYVMGGRCGWYLNSVETYSRLNDTWSYVGSLNRPRDFFSAVVHNDKIYVVGGVFDGRGPDEGDSIEVFNQDMDTWENVQTLPRTEGRKSVCVRRSSVAKKLEWK